MTAQQPSFNDREYDLLKKLVGNVYEIATGGGGTITGQVDYYADLSVTVGNPPLKSVYLVTNPSGVWLINFHPAGLYVRTGNIGTLSDWTYAGEFPDVFKDANFRVYNAVDPTKQIAFDVSPVSPAAIRTFAWPDANGTVALKGDIAFQAGGASSSFGTLNFKDANGITFSNNAGSLQISYSVPSTAGLISAIQFSAGTLSQNLASLVFANSNGISFGLSAGSITASHNGLTSQSNQAFSAAGGSSAFQTLSFGNGNGISFSNSNGSLVGSIASTYAGIGFTSAGTNISFSGTQGTNGLSLAASVAAQSAQPVAASAANGSFNFSTLSFSNLNGISFGTSAGSAITASHNGLTSQSNQAFSASGGSSAFQTLSFANSNGLTFSNSNGSVIASYTVPAVTNSSWTVSDSATSGTVGRLAFTNLNGITFSLSTGAAGLHTIVGSHNGLTSQFNQAFSASGGSSAFQTLNFANSNGITFSNSNGSVIASYTVPSTAGLISAINLSGGTTSNNLTAFVLSNSNNVSFGLNGSTITASASFAQSTQPVAASAANGSFAFSTLSFSNLNGISFGTSAGSAITASHNGLTSQSNQAFSANGGSSAFQTLGFSDGGGVTFTNTNGSVGASVRTDYASSNHSHGNPTLFLTNLSGTTASASNGLTFSLSAANPVTTNGLISAINFSAGTTSNNLSAITFNNANGISFGLNASVVTASYTVPTVTNSSWTVSDGATSATVGRLAFVNANGLTFGLSTSNNGNHSVTASYTVPNTTGLISFINVSGGTTSNNLTAVTFSNANGVSFGMNGSVMTASVAAAGGAQTGISGIQISNTTYTVGTVTFQNANGISFGSSGANGISASYTVPSTAGLISAINVSAGATSNNLSALTFSNGSNVTFGLAGSVVTASVASSLTAVNLSAGAASANLSAWTYGNSNGVSFGLNAGTITASVAAPATVFSFQNFPQANNVQSTTVGLANATEAYVVPFNLPNYLSMDTMRQYVSFSFISTTFGGTSANTTISGGTSVTNFAVFYSQDTGANSTVLRSITSVSFPFNFQLSIGNGTAGSQYTVSQFVTYPTGGGSSTFSTTYNVSSGTYNFSTTQLSNFTGLRNFDTSLGTLLSAGNYWIAFGRSVSSTSNSAPMGSRFGSSSIGFSPFPASTFGALGAATNATKGWVWGLGGYSDGATSASFSAVAFNSITARATYPMFALVKNQN